eukprot:4633299-Amphidinium_carterae.2
MHELPSYICVRELDALVSAKTATKPSEPSALAQNTEHHDIGSDHEAAPSSGKHVRASPSGTTVRQDRLKTKERK